MSFVLGLHSRALMLPETERKEYGVSSFAIDVICNRDMSSDRSLPLLCSAPYLMSFTASYVTAFSEFFAANALAGLSEGLVLFGLVRCHSLAANAPKKEDERTVSMS